MKAAIVILNYNGWEDTLKCLSSLKAMTIQPSQIILIDNASKEDRCAEIRDCFPEIRIQRNALNRGFAGGSNDGIKRALQEGADFVFLLNNDTVIAPNTMELLADGMSSSEDWGIIGPIINYMEEPETVGTDGCLFNLRNQSGLFTRKIITPSNSSSSILPTDIVNGCAMAIRREVFEKIGLFDESYFIVHEESDFCLRAAKAGFRNGILSKVLVWHKGSSSFQREGKDYQRYYDSRNLLRLLRLHGQFNGRTKRESLIAYLRYIYYRYCHEIEAGSNAAAQACLCGLADALFGRTGPRPAQSSFLAPGAIRGLFECIRRLN